MKRWMWILCGLLIFQFMEKTGTGVENLQPVQLLEMDRKNGKVILRTDLGDYGMGNSLPRALAHMQETSEGEIFLETADLLILRDGAEELLPQIVSDLRPAVRVCKGKGNLDLEKAAAYLTVHKPEVSLSEACYGNRELQILYRKEGRLILEYDP